MGILFVINRKRLNKKPMAKSEHSDLTRYKNLSWGIKNVFSLKLFARDICRNFKYDTEL